MTETTGTVATREDESSITLLPPVQPGSVAAYDALDRHVHAVKKANWLAEQMCSSDYVPAKFKGKPGDGAAAILFGAEVGLSPIASLRSVIVIHGQPGFEARTMKAILMGNGYRFRTLEATRDVCRVVAVSPNGDEAEAEITLDDCKLEGWVPTPRPGLDHAPDPDTKTDWVGEMKSGRNGEYFVVKGNMKYITSPRTMLIAKATAAVSRDIAPHLLLGMPAVEDMDTFGDEDEPRGPRQAARRATGSLRDRAKASDAAEEPVDAETVDMPEEPGQGGGNDQGEGAEPSAGTDLPHPPGDQDSSPAEEKPKSAMRKAVEKRLFALLGDAKVKDRDDRIAIYRAVLKRADITSTDDLDDPEVAAVGDQLYKWSRTAGELDRQITEIVNAATLSAESKEN